MWPNPQDIAVFVVFKEKYFTVNQISCAVDSINLFPHIVQ